MTETNRPKILVIAGPTGVGKTELSLRLTEVLGGEIVNADAMQVYRYMDIGTAKPSPAEQARAPHHMIDIVDPDEPFDAAAYVESARPIIAGLHDRGAPPIVVGGTGLYLRSLIRGLFVGPGQSPDIRARIKAEAGQVGWPALHERLKAIDPVTAARLSPNDRVRIERALEVFAMTGRPISEFQAEHSLRDQPYDVRFYVLNLPREVLYQRIEARTEWMIEAGLVEETARLLEQGYSPDLKPLLAIGYKEIVRHLMGRMTLPAAVVEIKKQTRHYAKRQLTWLRAEPDAVWVHPEETERVLAEAKTFLPE